MPGNGSVWIRWRRSDRKQPASKAARYRRRDGGRYQVTRADTDDGSALYAWNPIVLFRVEYIRQR
jgi:hypothetical protein